MSQTDLIIDRIVKCLSERIRINDDDDQNKIKIKDLFVHRIDSLVLFCKRSQMDDGVSDKLVKYRNLTRNKITRERQKITMLNHKIDALMNKETYKSNVITIELDNEIIKYIIEKCDLAKDLDINYLIVNNIELLILLFELDYESVIADELTYYRDVLFEQSENNDIMNKLNEIEQKIDMLLMSPDFPNGKKIFDDAKEEFNKYANESITIT